jgi:hypothetical protein
MEKLRRSHPEQLRIESPGLQLPTLRILSPGNKEPPPPAVIGLFQKSIPEKRIRPFHPPRESTKALMEIRGMVKGMPLAKDRDLGQGFIPLRQMGEVGVGLPPCVGKRDDLKVSAFLKSLRESGGLPLVINRDSDFLRHPPEPSEILLMAGDDQFYLAGGSRHDVREIARSGA